MLLSDQQRSMGLSGSPKRRVQFCKGTGSQSIVAAVVGAPDWSLAKDIQGLVLVGLRSQHWL